MSEGNIVTTYVLKLRLFSRDVRLYLITASLVGLCWMGISAVLFNLYLLRLGYDTAFIGLVNAAGMLTYAIFSLPAGALGARRGIRRMMIVGLSLGAIGLVLPLLVEFIPAALQEGWLLVTYSLGYLGAALYVVNADIFVMGATGPAERSYVFSVQVALWPLAAFIGSLIGGLLPQFFATVSSASLDSPTPYRDSLFIGVAIFCLGVPILLATREVQQADTKKRVSGAGPAPYGLIALLALVQLLQGTGEGAARTFFNVYLDVGLDVATQYIGTLTAVGQLLAVPAALATPLLIARWRTGPTFVRASMGITLSLLPLALISHWGAGGLAFMGVMAMGSVSRPAFLLYRMEIVSPDWWAVASGAINMAFGLSWAAIALGGGYMVTTRGWPSLYLTGAGVTAAGILLFWAYFRAPRGELAKHVALDTAEA